MRSDPDNLNEFGSTPAALAKHIALCTQTPLYSTCLSDITIPTDANVVLGGYDAKLQDYMNSTAIVMTFLLNNAPSANFTELYADEANGTAAMNAAYLKAAMDWEAAFIAQVQEYKRDPRFANFSIAYRYTHTHIHTYTYTHTHTHTHIHTHIYIHTSSLA